MRIDIDIDNNIVIAADGTLVITRRSIMGQLAVHTIKTEYHPIAIAAWIWMKINHKPCAFILDEFPNMGREDAEFLISGITPEEWNRMFPKEDDE